MCAENIKGLWNLFCCGGCCACCYNCDGFCGPRYSNHPLKEALLDRFGDMKLGEALTPVQIVAYDIEQNKPIYFNSLAHPDMMFVDAALASSAAPTYFPGVKVSDGHHSYHCVDGGLFDNCSSMAAVRFAMANYHKNFHTRNLSELIRFDDFVVASIGTGAALESSRAEKLKRAGKLGWAAAGIEVSMTGTTQATHFNLGEIFEIREEITKVKKYFPFQVSLSAKEASMDDSSKIELLANKARRDNFGAREDYKRFVNEHIKGKKRADLPALAARMTLHL